MASPIDLRGRKDSHGRSGRRFSSASPSWPGHVRSLWRRHGAAYLLVLPCVALLLVMMVYPLIQTIRFSFSEVELPFLSLRYVGLANFQRIFLQSDIAGVLGRTVLWLAGTVSLRFLLGFWAALTFNVRVRGGTVLRVLCILPWTVPSIVSANLWRWILQSGTGVLNQTLAEIGLGAWAHQWLASPGTAELSVMVAFSWAGFPFVMLMLLAGMQGIPDEIYEAARLDGATTLQQFRYLTLPLLRNMISIVLLLEMISAFNSFDALYVMTGGGPGNASQILSLFIYQQGFTNFDFGGASALSLGLLAIALMVFIFYSALSGAARKEQPA